MRLLNRKEFKIFITFFIIYSFFIQWLGSNEYSRFGLTRSIVDDGRFEIDSYFNTTRDRSYYNGHYYSDKDPGLSFVAVPVYTFWKLIYDNLFSIAFKEKYSVSKDVVNFEIGQNKIIISQYVNPGFFILFSMVLVTIFTSSLFSALLLLLIYKISRYFTANEKYRLLITFTTGLGTLIFPYALVFMEHAIATFFAFLSFYLLFKVKQEKLKENKYFILAGLSIGLSITCSISTIIVGIACLIYILSFKKEKILYFIFGSFIGILPFLLYNYLSFGNPFTLPRHYLDSTIWTKLGGIDGLGLPNPFVIIRLMFYPEKGIFFYYPVLLLSFIGLYYMYKKFKIESILILFIFFAFLILNSSWWAWWGGASFGPRHLTPVSTFLILPLIYVFKNFDSKRILKYTVIFLILYSIFVNFAGLQTSKDELGSGPLSSEYEKKINTFEIIINPLYDYYIPNFIKDGPRSRIFESIFLNDEILIDIRTPNEYYKFMHNPIFRAYLEIPFLCLLPIIFIIFLIWWEEVRVL